MNHLRESLPHVSPCTTSEWGKYKEGTCPHYDKNDTLEKEKGKITSNTTQTIIHIIIAFDMELLNLGAKSTF